VYFFLLNYEIQKSKNQKINLLYSFFFGFKFILLIFNNNICQNISIYFKKNSYIFKEILN
jgi:hypothetical protein